MRSIEEILMESHGLPERPKNYVRTGKETEDLKAGAHCQVCLDTGFFVPAVDPGDPNFGRAVPCACVGAVVARRLWSSSGLNEAERTWLTSYAKGQAQKDLAIGHVELLLERRHGWLTIWGHYGVGKTGLLKSSVATRITAGRMAYYRRAADILAEARDTYNKDADGREADVFSRYATADWLAIDEVDRIQMTPWSFTWLQGLLDERYSRRHTTVTIMATNTKIKDLAPEWGYLTSRMADGVIVAMGGDSLRKGPQDAQV